MLSGVRLVTELGELNLTDVQVDTGLNYAIHASPRALQDGFGVAWKALCTRLPDGNVRGFGGTTKTWVWTASLRVGPWTFVDCEIHVPRGRGHDDGGWLVGLPVLRHFDIHMRTDQNRPIPGPVLVGPDPQACHVSYLNSRPGHLPGQWLPAR